MVAFAVVAAQILKIDLARSVFYIRVITSVTASPGTACVVLLCYYEQTVLDCGRHVSGRT